jgi:benzoyl-CoA reductase subunit C
LNVFSYPASVDTIVPPEVSGQMNSEDAWQPFRAVLQAPLENARKWKEKTGGKVVGHLLPDVPEEIIHAAGALPVAIEGASVPVSHAQAHIPGYTCAHAMGALELGLRGGLDVLDGMLIPYVCDTTRNLFHIWNHCVSGISNEFVRLPKRLEFPEARSYLEAEFTRLVRVTEKIGGLTIGPDRLATSVSLYNKSRAKLRQAYDRHGKQPSVWTAERVHLLIGSALRAPREDHLSWMEALPWDDSSPENLSQKIPLYVRGKIWDPPGILTILDSLGYIVARDEIVTGFRGIAQDAKLNGDPIKALVERHLTTVPYAGYHVRPTKVVEGFVERVRESGARGVLFLNPKFCEAAAFDLPDLQKALKVLEIPSLVLETSTRGVALEQIRMRLEAFREMISDDLP